MRRRRRRVRRQSIERGGAGEKARIVAGGKEKQLIRKQFEVEQQKKREKLKKLIDAVTNSEDNVVSCILKHAPGCSKARQSIGMQTLKTEQVHNFDDLTKTLNEVEINCDLVEAVEKWRKAKLVLANHRGNNELVEYDKDEDRKRMSWALYGSSALPFLNGNNTLLHLTTDFDFLDNCGQLKE